MNNYNNNRRKQRGEFNHHYHHQLQHHNYNNNQEAQGKRSYHHRRPPLHGCWQPTVPSWEKTFCRSVGLVPWEKILETKKSMYLYDNVIQWKDSAVEEAFHNAKSRFWAEINGLPCNISLPDPNIYIDEVDWNCDVDPELLLDLEREPKEVDEGKTPEVVVILGIVNQPFSCTGWGETEDDNLQKVPETTLDRGCTDWDPNGDFVPVNNFPQDGGWGSAWNDSPGLGNNRNEWENSNNQWTSTNNQRWETWGRNGGQKKEGSSGGWYKPSRFHGEHRAVDRGWWKNGRGRKNVNFAY